MGGCGAAFLAAEDERLDQSRYGPDVAALSALVRRVAPAWIVAPATSRFSRALPGLAVRIGGAIDTHVVGLGAENGVVFAERWYYRQRMRAKLSRDTRPWILLLDGGAFPAWEGEAKPVEAEAVDPWERGSADAATRTRVLREENTEIGSETIRPDADVLLVAGAGWTKKQADGQSHPARAEELILGFLAGARASLGSSKSLVDQSSEGHAVLSCLSHLHQVGQTGSTPRHPKGLATCCHGEEPHVVGWRFIGERRAVNLDANCGWARGKADVLYVADAFAVLAKVNELLAAR
jgi:electron transfer flavoprotein alpha subunit